MKVCCAHGKKCSVSNIFIRMVHSFTVSNINRYKLKHAFITAKENKLFSIKATSIQANHMLLL